MYVYVYVYVCEGEGGCALREECKAVYMRPEIGDRSPKKQTNKYKRRTDVKEGEER